MKIPSAIFAIAILHSSTPGLFAQGGGPLTPPGAPAPTMKTLQEIEPRTPLIEGAASTGAVQTDDANSHFVIRQGGSYYLAQNLSVTRVNGIVISAAGVTIDLNGFRIATDNTTSIGDGIHVSNVSHHCSIKNGSISGMLYGIRAESVSGIYANACTAKELTVGDCGFYGLYLEGAWDVSACRARNTRSGTGILTGPGSTVNTCIAIGNDVGIIANDSTIIGCSAFGNTGSGISSSRSNIINCSSNFNRGTSIVAAGIGSDGGAIINCTASGNGGDGFQVSDGATLEGCTAKNNKGDGIQADTHCFIRDNLSDGNTGFGIHTTGVRNRIDGNQVSRNAIGIVVDAENSLIVRNTTSGNTPNWQIAKNNDVGVIVDPPSSPAINGNTGGSGVTTTDPWANFSY